jgi:hypothetical protein
MPGLLEIGHLAKRHSLLFVEEIVVEYDIPYSN